MLTQVVRGDVVLDVYADGPTVDAARGVVLALHGFPQSSKGWRAVLPGLHSLGLRTLAPDQRGYSPGGVPEAVRDYRLHRLVDDALAVLDDAGAESAVLLGHDWGAVVAWAVAAAHPARVSALVAISVPHPRAYAAALRHDADQKRRSSYIQLFREQGKAESVLSRDQGRRLRHMFAGSGLSADEVAAHCDPLLADGARRLTGALSWYRAVGGLEMAEVGPVAMPTTYVWSDNDLAVGRAAADGCAVHVHGDYRRVDLPGVSHWVPEQAPEAVVDAVAGRLT